MAIGSTSLAQQYGIVIHGGAGSMTPENLPQELQQAYLTALEEARDIGYAILEKGGTAEDAVVAAITVMENNPLFNAGKGSVLNAKGEVEMDASIMLGQSLEAGAVAGVRLVRNPIKAAQAVMHDSPHVMLSNHGADAFAQERGLPLEKPAYFITEKRLKALKEVQERSKQQGDVSNWELSKYGTVGAVALDQYGNLAAGTSTGGMTNKQHNRVGDSPIIGAGTYADNGSCGVSSTGHGEYFIRLGVAKEVGSLMKYKGYDVEKAASYVIHKQLEELGGDGGVIAMDRRGNVSMPFNTSGMFRAFRLSDGRSKAAIF